MEDWSHALAGLVGALLSEPTQKAYQHIVKGCRSSVQRQGVVDLFSSEAIYAFLQALRDQGRSVSYMRAHLVVASFYAKLRGVQDAGNSFLVRKALAEWSRLEGARKDGRRPLNLHTLGEMLHALQSVCSSAYEVTLFAAAFILAFYGAFRVYELVGTSESNTAGGLQWQDVKLLQGGLSIILHRSKMDP